MKKETKENLITFGAIGASLACAATGHCQLGIPILAGAMAYNLKGRLPKKA
ncbi:MAG: hypothetical protein FWF59_11600 [Turicibacter sp.]|nr:hypothetical protein [Turicibacter sp.]